MIHRLISHNGRLLSVEDARLSPGQAGLMSGWGLFTTMRIVEGVPFAFERHWKRLSRDAEKTHCPFPFDEGTVRLQLAQVLSANQVQEGCARIYVMQNRMGFWRTDENFPESDLLICSSELPSYREEMRLALRPHGRHAASPLAGVKVTSWLNNVWSLYEAQQAGYDEVVLLNERGEVAECTAANIFCVSRGRVATPQLSSGCLAGVTREVLLEIGESVGVPVEERALMPEDLFAADEVFVSSTNRSLLPVSVIDGKKVSPSPGDARQKLEKAFARYVRVYVESHSAASAKR